MKKTEMIKEIRRELDGAKNFEIYSYFNYPNFRGLDLFGTYELREFICGDYTSSIESVDDNIQEHIQAVFGEESVDKSFVIDVCEMDENEYNMRVDYTGDTPFSTLYSSGEKVKVITIGYEVE